MLDGGSDGGSCVRHGNRLCPETVIPTARIISALDVLVRIHLLKGVWHIF